MVDLEKENLEEFFKKPIEDVENELNAMELKLKQAEDLHNQNIAEVRIAAISLERKKLKARDSENEIVETENEIKRLRQKIEEYKKQQDNGEKKNIFANCFEFNSVELQKVLELFDLQIKAQNEKIEKDNETIKEMVNNEIKNKGIAKEKEKIDIVIDLPEQNPDEIIDGSNVFILPIEEDFPKNRKKINFLRSFRDWIVTKIEKAREIKYPEGPMDFSGDVIKKNENYKPRVMVKKKKVNPFDSINDKGELILK